MIDHHIPDHYYMLNGISRSFLLEEIHFEFKGCSIVFYEYNFT